MSTGKHLASILVLTLFINTTTNTEEKSIQQHGKGYIVPSKYNYRLDKIGCYMYTRPKSTRAKLCFSIKKQQYLLYICYILLLQASDIELNPGPNTTTFPCNICGNEVDWDQKAVACDNCSDWYHTSCLVKVPPYSKWTFQGEIFFTPNWCNITLNILRRRKIKL